MLSKSRCSPAAVTSDSEIRAGWGWKNQRELILYFATHLDHICSNFSSKESFDCHLRYSSSFFKGLLQCFIDLGQVTTALTHVDGVVTRRFVETVTQMKVCVMWTVHKLHFILRIHIPTVSNRAWFLTKDSTLVAKA